MFNNGEDIDLCDDLDLLSFILKEVSFQCELFSDCSVCSCKYEDNSDFMCRKEHLKHRLKELKGDI